MNFISAAKRTFIFLIALHFATNVFTQTYVSPTGSDITGNGTVNLPYATILKGIFSTATGGTIFIGSGTYNQTSEIYLDRAMTLQRFGNAPAIIDASTRSAGGSSTYMIAIVNASNVTIDGLTFQNYISNSAKGIFVLGAGNNINIQNCNFKNIGWTNNNLTLLPPNSSTIANAIRVEGSLTPSLTNINIKNNDVGNCATGWAEAITVTGNVDGFTIENNVVHEIANIGIVAAGNYFTGAPNNLNQARNGIIRKNEVFNCMSGIAISAGIYLDGAINCIVEQNKTYQNGAGISVGSEQSLLTGSNASTGNIIRNNLVFANALTGISWGTNNPANTIFNSSVLNNSFYKNRTGANINGIIAVGGTPVNLLADNFGGEVLLLNLNGANMQNNILYPSIGKRAMVALSTYTATNFSANYNVYYHDDLAPLIDLTGNNFNGITTTNSFGSLTAFNAATGLEANSVFGEPSFINPALQNFLSTNVALQIDKGNTVYNATQNGLTDFAGNARVFNSRMDAGAYEFAGTNYPAVQYTFTGNGNWNVPANWQTGLMPPTVLTTGSSIIINPIVGGECILNMSQTLMSGTTITVNNNAKLRLPKNLLHQ
jgi:parallel beta-helix repeat protein